METKVLVIADLHWLDIWKKLIAKEKPDKVIFLGDYVDSFDVSDIDMIANLNNIIEHKKKNMDSTILLLGNHDLQYIYLECKCSSYRASYAWIIWQLLKDNKDLFQIAHEEWGTLFTHAWVGEGWYKKHESLLDNYSTALGESLNMVYNSRDRGILFHAGAARWGFNTYGWPVWCDKSEDKIEWLLQVMWHTPVKQVTDIKWNLYCDVLEHGNGDPLILIFK